jgi:hypothetical protein
MTERARGLRIWMVAVALTAAVAGVMLATAGGQRHAGGTDRDALRLRLAAALASSGRSPQATAVTPARTAARGDRALAALRRAAGKANKATTRHGAALVGALGSTGQDSEAGYRRLAEAAVRLRADVVALRDAFKRVKPHSKPSRAARRLALRTQTAAAAGTDAIRRFAATSEPGEAQALAARAETALGRAQTLARRASRKLGCRKPCGSGF